MKTANSQRVREYAEQQFVRPARRRGESTVRIVAGEVHRALRLENRIPQVCAALKSGKFLVDNHLMLDRMEGPPSGMSTTATFTYRLLDENHGESAESPLNRLWGAGKDVFQSLGGGEAFIRAERDRFDGPAKNS